MTNKTSLFDCKCLHCQKKLDEAVLKLDEIKVLPEGKISKKSE